MPRPGPLRGGPRPVATRPTAPGSPRWAAAIPVISGPKFPAKDGAPRFCSPPGGGARRHSSWEGLARGYRRHPTGLAGVVAGIVLGGAGPFYAPCSSLLGGASPSHCSGDVHDHREPRDGGAIEVLCRTPDE